MSDGNVVGFRSRIYSPSRINYIQAVTCRHQQGVGGDYPDRSRPRKHSVLLHMVQSINGEEKIPSWSWTDVHNSKFQMTGSACTYTFKISDIKSFYELTDSELAGLTELGFIVKNESGSQTGDFYVSVVQGRTDAYSGGEGTQDNPFILKNVEDLKEFASTSIDWAEDVYLRLDADIDASSLDTPIASKGSPFCGHFDGAGHSISNLRLTETAVGEAVGLFVALRMVKSKISV